MAFSFFSSLLPVVHADAPAEDKEEENQNQEVEKKDEGAGEGGEGEGEEAEAPEEPEEEEEEPEDILPGLREECADSTKCKTATEHFRHCEEKVNAGQGYKGEDCIEEFMMHCVDGCVAPKLFAKLK